MNRDWPRAAKRPSGPKSSTIAMVMGALVFLGWMLVNSQTWSAANIVDLAEVKVDMHCHTTESDGDRTAEEQIQLASTIGLEALWITDHDMIRDLPRTHELQRVGRQAGVDVSFGVEITVLWAKKEHHLLGYFPDTAWAGTQLSPPMVQLQKAVAEVKDSRENRNQMMVAFLNKLLASPEGISYFTDPVKHAQFQPLNVATVAEWAKINANLMEPTSLGRPHFRAYLIQVVGVREDLIFGPRAGDGVATLADDGKVYFDAEREGKTGPEIEALMHSATLAKRNIAFEPLPILEAIRMIRSADGRAVLAHPPTLGSSWVDKFAPKVEELAANGLWGIEAFSSEIDEDNNAVIQLLAKRHNLVMTGGSDNHGSLKIYAQLGKVSRAQGKTYAELEYWAREGLKRSQYVRGEL
eukprot:TRINITY_DN10609_c0_g1_i4.p1 TRINITY_DN10609_c0_g1~~TRINITY_DN10609_c0_g1_i4.p1  ORF type:complete len:410 (+),score=65.74 TRINITY_DN10609_c0_g1_i4:165-1394(+)